MKVAGIALTTGLLPILSVHTTFLISACYGHINWCFPYLAHCTSISATGRQVPEFFVFKALMIPSAMFLLLFWHLAARWLSAQSLKPSFTIFAMQLIGMAGALFLILYATMLGADGDLFQLQRRIGVILYFTFTYLAQLMLLKSIFRLSPAPARGIRISMLTIQCILLSLGIISLILGQIMTSYGNIENAFEWLMALLIHLYFFTIYLCWRRSSFQVDYTTQGS